MPQTNNLSIGRRGLLKTGAVAGAASGLLARPALAQGAPVKIGHIDSTTGNFAVLGDSQIAGAKLAVAELNAAGGILGRKVELHVEDDAGSPSTGLDKASRLLDQENVDFFIGTTSSAVSLSPQPVRGLARQGFYVHRRSCGQAHWRLLQLGDVSGVLDHLDSDIRRFQDTCR